MLETANGWGNLELRNSGKEQGQEGWDADESFDPFDKLRAGFAQDRCVKRQTVGRIWNSGTQEKNNSQRGGTRTNADDVDMGCCGRDEADDR